MYMYRAFLGHLHEDIVDNRKHLLVTAVGNYRVHTSHRIHTNRPNGRGDYQLLYIAAGRAQFFFAGREQFLPKGTVVLFRPGDPQHYNLYAADQAETFWVHFTGNEAEKFLEQYQLPKGQTVFYTGTSPDYPFLFRQMIRELQVRRIGFSELLNINLQHMLLLICRSLKENRQHRTKILDEIDRATHYFNENFNHPINIGQYAKDRLMSPSWFIRNFKQITDITPMQYLVNQRMLNAMGLLEHTEYNITQVAAAVGYENPLYFSRLFRKQIGLSPTEYRKISKKSNLPK